MIRLAALVTAFALSASQAGAQTDDLCTASLSRLNALLIAVAGLPAPIAGEVRAIGDETCHIADPDLPGPPRMRLKADAFRFSGADMARFAETGLPPRTLELRLVGVRMHPEVGDPLMTYLMGVQGDRRRADVALTAAWDEGARVLDLTDASIAFSSGDFIRFSGRIEDVDLTDFTAIGASAGTFGLTRIVAEVRSENGLFESFALMPLGMALLRGVPDPEARVNELKVLGLAEIMALPEAQFPHGSKMALSALLSDMPNPDGTLRIEITATPGLGVARGMALAARAETLETLGEVWPLLDGVAYDITYKRR